MNPRYLTVSDVAAIGEREAGPHMLADLGLLEAAVLRPQTTVGGLDAYPDMHTKAAALLHSLARNHPFIDGNKRVAATAMIVFYVWNGYAFHAEQDQLVALVTDVAAGQLDVDQIAAQLKGHAWDAIDSLPEGP